LWAGTPYPYKDDALKAYLETQKIPLLPETQYFDTYVLTRTGVTRSTNHDVKRKLGFADVQPFNKAMLDAVTHVASTSVGDDCGEGFTTPREWTRRFAWLNASRRAHSSAQ
jgi:hypothetical protein